MAAVALPEGFRWTWAGDTVRINLPPLVRTETSTLEPMLSRGIAERVAEAVVAYDRKRRAAQRGDPVARVLLAHDPRYAPETLTTFRTKLSLALVEQGNKATIDQMVTMSDTDEPM